LPRKALKLGGTSILVLLRGPTEVFRNGVQEFKEAEKLRSGKRGRKGVALDAQQDKRNYVLIIF